MKEIDGFVWLDTRFRSDMQALLNLERDYSFLAQESDIRILKNHLITMSDIFSLESDEIARVSQLIDQTYSEQKDKDKIEYQEILASFDPNYSDYASITEDNHLRFRDTLLNDLHVANNPARKEKIIEVEWETKKFISQVPYKADLIRQGILVLIMSSFEHLWKELREFYLLKLPPNNVEEFRKCNVFDKQIAYLNEKVGIDLSCVMSSDVFLAGRRNRRNLFVHNDGVVSDEYFHLFKDEMNVKINDRLTVPNKYLLLTIDEIEFFGLVLLQNTWRYFSNGNERKKSILALKQWVFDLVYNQRYDLAIRAADFAYLLRLPDIEYQEIYINHAIALRELNRPQVEIEKVISKANFALSNNLLYQAAVYCLRKETKEMYALLPEIAKQVPKRLLLEWPIFAHVREDRDFLKAISM